MPLTGLVRHVVVADSDAAAVEIARRAYPLWRHHMNYLWAKRGTQFTLGGIFPESYEDLAKIGHAAVGSPDTVRRELSAQLDEAGSAYLACQMTFGNMSRDECLRSIRLFGTEVMPALRADIQKRRTPEQSQHSPTARAS